jgi:hypothetical protein
MPTHDQLQASGVGFVTTVRPGWDLRPCGVGPECDVLKRTGEPSRSEEEGL